MNDDSPLINWKHYYVVLNFNVNEKEPILMVYSTSKVDKAIYRIKRSRQPLQTLVIINRYESNLFPARSAFDCNLIRPTSYENLIKKIQEGKVTHKGIIEIPILRKLRLGLLSSKTVDPLYKKMIRQAESTPC